MAPGRSLLLLAAAGGLGACALDEDPAEIATGAQPVVGGTITTGDPGVVALRTSTNRVFCTGTLVSPQVVLSAGHCLAEAGGDPQVSVFFGSDAASTGLSIDITMSRAHPGWTGDLANGHDLSVSLLATPQDLALVVPMNKADLAAHVGAPYRVVGFGIHDRETRELDGKKRVGQMSITGLTGDYLEASDVDPDQATAICQGDSGGPGFITIDDGSGPREVLAGVHSYSITGCFNPSGDARPDLYMADFIQPFIDANDVTCQLNSVCNRDLCTADPDCLPCNGDGTCHTDCPNPDPDCATAGLGDICQADTQCTTGLCIVWPQDTHSHFCSKSCAGDGDCPVPGMVCRDRPGEGRVCDYSGEPPGAIGQACTAPDQCSAYLCVEGACTYDCNIPRGEHCPADYRCDTVDGTSYVCLPALPEDEGGCCSAGAGGAGARGGVLLAMFTVGMLARRRRRRAP